MDIVYFIVWAALLQGFILSLIYIFSKKRRSTANTLLGLFLLSILIMAFSSISPYKNIGQYNFTEYFAIPHVLLFAPVLFFHFVLEKLGNAHKYTFFLRVNYFIASSIGLITVLNLYLFVFESSSIVETFEFSSVFWFHISISSYSFLICVFVFFTSWREVTQYKMLVQNEFSDYNLLHINWLINLIYVLLPVVILWGVALFRTLLVTGFSTELDLPIFGLIAVFLFYLSYQAYLHPNLFERLPESILKKGRKESNATTSRVTDDEENGQMIERLMSEDEHYLDHDLTISVFANSIGISPRKISSIINQDFKKNFNEWVNDFRVKKAKELMESDSENRYSIEGIGMESGFKSRSALYAAFKNKLGSTPGEFRKHLEAEKLS